MDILSAAELLGYKPARLDRIVARIKCPWCGSKMWLALLYDRFACSNPDCEEAGNAEQPLRFAPRASA